MRPSATRRLVHDGVVSFLKFMFDSDYQQRQDIEELRDAQFAMALQGSGASTEWVQGIAVELKELATTVHVLMRTLQQAGLLDVDKIRAEVTEELKPKPRLPKAKHRRRPPPEPSGPPTEVTCARCQANGWSNDMVRVGADAWCRSCARNP